jgi:hypothetical protein
MAGTDIVITKKDELALASDPIAYTEMALGRAIGWLQEARGADELREARAIAASMETFIRERELGFDAQRNAAEMVTRVQREIAKIERAAVGPKGRHRSSSAPEDEAPPTGGRRAVEDKALAEAAPEQLDEAIAEVRAEGKSPTPGAVARKVRVDPGVNPLAAEMAPLEGLFGSILGLGQRVERDYDAILELLARAPEDRRREWKKQAQRGSRALAQLTRALKAPERQ